MHESTEAKRYCKLVKTEHNHQKPPVLVRFIAGSVFFTTMQMC